jgi:hypothetical protein
VALIRDIVQTLRADPREALESVAVCGAAALLGYLVLLGGN